MPRGGKNRQSRRDDAPGSRPGGGLTGDEDYDWIRYLGEGRSSSGPSPSGPSPSGGSPPQAPSQLPARDRREGRRSHPGRAEHPSWPEQQIGYADQQRLAAESPLPGPPPGDGRTGPMTRPGRAVKVRHGRTTDLLFNPDAEEYGQPLYPPANGERPGWPQQDRPQQDWPQQDWHQEDWQRGDWERRRGLDTAEYARPLYPSYEADPATDSRSRRSRPGDDPLADTNTRSRRSRRSGDPLADTGTRTRILPPERRPALPLGRSARGGNLDRASAPPEPQDFTLPPGRRGIPPVRPGRDDVTIPPGRRGVPPALPRRTTRTGPQPRIRDLGPADRAADSGMGRVGGYDSGVGLVGGPADSGVGFAGAVTRATGPVAEYVVTDLMPKNGRRAEITATAHAADPQGTATLAPARSPVKPDRKQRKAGPPGPKPGKSRARAKKAASAGRSRRRVPVTARVLLAVVLVAAVGVAGYVFLWPKTSHVVSAPARAAGYARQQANATANQLKQRIVKAAGGSVSHVVAAVYQRSSGPGTSNGPQVIVFIGGNLTGGSSASGLITAYINGLSSAFTTSPGSLGGQAACAPGSHGGPAECAWADNDTFGVLVSATMNSVSLASQMRQMRPLVEHVAR
jgi:hypothetical protein